MGIIGRHVVFMWRHDSEGICGIPAHGGEVFLFGNFIYCKIEKIMLISR
jgi:hypothetical protein